MVTVCGDGMKKREGGGEEREDEREVLYLARLAIVYSSTTDHQGTVSHIYLKDTSSIVLHL